MTPCAGLSLRGCFVRLLSPEGGHFYARRQYEHQKGTITMQTIKRTLTAALAALVLLLAVSVAAPAAFAADYQDGTYTVPFSMDGLGRHNVAWDTATVHVEGGKLYVDFTLERVDPRDHAPTYDWLKTDCGTFYPTTNEAAFTQTFSRVEVSSLGAIDVNAYSISMNHIMEYTLHIDGSSIPEAAAEEPTPEPAPEPAPEPTPEPAPEPAPVEPAPTEPEPAPAPVEPAPDAPVSNEPDQNSEQPAEAADTAADEPVGTGVDGEMTITAVDGETGESPEIEPVTTIGADSPDTVSPAPAGLSTGDVVGAAAVSAGTLIVAGGLVWLLRRKNG